MFLIAFMRFSLLSNFSSVPDRKEKKLYENPDNLACDSKKEFSGLKIQTCLVWSKRERNPMHNSWSYGNGIKYD